MMGAFVSTFYVVPPDDLVVQQVKDHYECHWYEQSQKHRGNR